MATKLEFNNISFLSHFSQLDDLRIDRKKLYPLNEELLIIFCGAICGAEGWRDLEMFGYEKLNFLKKFLHDENGIPSHDTFGRIFSLLDPKTFADCFIYMPENPAAF